MFVTSIGQNPPFHRRKRDCDWSAEAQTQPPFHQWTSRTRGNLKLHTAVLENALRIVIHLLQSARKRRFCTKRKTDLSAHPDTPKISVGRGNKSISAFKPNQENETIARATENDSPLNGMNDTLKE
jgi:hypothetical protein